MQDKPSGCWSRAKQAEKRLVSCRDKQSGGCSCVRLAGLGRDKQSGSWSRARQAVMGLVSSKTSSKGAGLVQDKLSGEWSRAR